MRHGFVHLILSLLHFASPTPFLDERGTNSEGVRLPPEVVEGGKRLALFFLNVMGNQYWLVISLIGIDKLYVGCALYPF